MEISFGNQSAETPVQLDQISGNLLTPAVTVIPHGIAKVLRDSEPIIPEPTHEELAQDQAEILFDEADILLDETGILTKINGAGNATVTEYSHEVVTSDGQTYYAFLAEYTDRWTRTIPPRRNPLMGIRVIHSRTNDPKDLDVSLEDGGLNFKEDEYGNVDLYSLDATIGQPVANSTDNLAYMGAIIADIKAQHTEAQKLAMLPVETIEKSEEDKPQFTKKQLIALGAGAITVAASLLGFAKQFTESQEQPHSPQYDTSYIQPKEPNIHFGEPSYPTNPSYPPEEYVSPKDGIRIPLPDAPPASITTPPEPPFSKGEDNYPSQDPDSSPEWDWNMPKHSNSNRPVFQPQIYPDSISPQ
jgi:hypothetical protein